jgi:hypothetical protein
MKRDVPIARVDGVTAVRMLPITESYEVKNGTRDPGSADPVTIERHSTQPAAGDAGKGIEDPVTLSTAARDRERAATHPRFGALSVKAHLNPHLAHQLASDYGHMDYRPLLDLREQEGTRTGPIEYSATGAPVTPESEALFQQLAARLRAASSALYDEERAKGTDAADIFDQLIALGDAQSVELRDMLDWDAKTADRVTPAPEDPGADAPLASNSTPGVGALGGGSGHALGSA